MKDKLKILAMIIFGIIIGVFSKYSDTSGKTFSHYFGILSSGIFFWFFIATLILCLSKTRKLFNLYYLSFMGSMLVSYYLYSKYVIGYYYSKIVWFWIIMLFITTIIGNIFYNMRKTKLFRCLFIIGSIVLIIYDGIKLYGFGNRTFIIEIILSIIGYIIINKESNKKIEMEMKIMKVVFLKNWNDWVFKKCWVTKKIPLHNIFMRRFFIIIIIIGILVPFVGTSLGAFTVFFLKNKINKRIENLLLGFSAGVMLAASLFSLLIPSIEQAHSYGKLEFIPAAVGFLLGMAFLIIVDIFENKDNTKSKLSFAVTLHNVPEGMAVGVAFASLLVSNSALNVASAMALSIGIAIQNFPEGAIISLPKKAQGETKLKSFKAGVLSGVVEPIAALITILLINIIVPILPYLLSFAAGSMIYVVVSELIPNGEDKRIINNIGITIGFVIMMILDVLLG